MPLMKAQSWQIEEITKLSLVLIIGIILAVFIINASGGLGKMVEEFCLKYPSWCGGASPDTPESEIARESTRALAFAINCVSDPESCSIPPGGKVFSPETTQSGTEDDNDITVKCDEKFTTTEEPMNEGWLDDEEGYLNRDRSKYFDCEKYEDEEYQPYESMYNCKYCRIGNYDEDIQLCVVGEGRKECEVINFQLPQEVSSAEDWISGYGDPKYLVYWQDFPADQDTWSYQSSLKVAVAMGLLTAFPATRVAGSAVRLGLKTTARSISSRAILKQEMFKEAQTIFTKRVSQEKIRMIAKASGFAAADYAAVVYDSVNEKYERKPNKIVLKSPFTEPDTYSLTSKLNYKPVMQLWDPGPVTGERIMSAHLVSPCYLDTLKVRFYPQEGDEVMLCSGFTYYSRDGGVHCTDTYVEEEGSWWNPLADDPKDKPVCDPEKYFGDDSEYTGSLSRLTATPVLNLSKELEKTYKIEEWVWFDEDEYYGDIEIGEVVVDDETGEIGLWVKGILSDEPGKIPEQIKITKKDDEDRQMILIDTIDDDRAGYFDTIALKDCRVDMVVLEIPDDGKTEGMDSNYCVDESGNLKTVLEWTGGIATVGAIVVSGFFTGGSTWAAALAVAGGGLFVGSEIEDYRDNWP
jgi:hypothetical protein